MMMTDWNVQNTKVLKGNETNLAQIKIGCAESQDELYFAIYIVPCQMYPQWDIGR